jgi:hypothetical protein
MSIDEAKLAQNRWMSGPPNIDWPALVDLTVRLTELRQNECKHLAIENFAPELFGNLLRECRNL